MLDFYNLVYQKYQGTIASIFGLLVLGTSFHSSQVVDFEV